MRKWEGELDVFRVPDLLGGGEEHLEGLRMKIQRGEPSCTSKMAGKVEVASNLPPRDISLSSRRV